MSFQIFPTKGTLIFNKYMEKRTIYERERIEALSKIEGTILNNDNYTILSQRTQLYKKFLKYAFKYANRYHIPNTLYKKVTSRSKNIATFSYLNQHMPNTSIWIETKQVIQTTLGDVAAFFFYSPEQEYLIWKYTVPEKDLLYKAVVSRILTDKGWWILDAVDSSGNSVLVIRYSKTFQQWELPQTHLCPFKKCRYIRTAGKKSPSIIPCKGCEKAFNLLRQWFCTAYELTDTQFNKTTTPQKSTKTDILHPKTLKEKKVPPLKTSPRLNKQLQRAEDINKPFLLLSSQPQKPPPPEISLPQTQKPPPPEIPPSQPVQPKSSSNPLLIEHYIEKHNRKAVTIEKSHKYLWMHSAWIMTEALRLHTDDTPLRLPSHSIYIELEQPRQIREHEVAALSFLQNEKPYWTLSTINKEGQTIWSACYEGGAWTLPNDYSCPKQQCITENVEGIIAYTLCTTCQEHITYYTSWLAIALRMITGDFQEQVEMREPEVTVEPSSRKRTVHRYQIIRYHDASKRKDNQPQNKRGSWMSGRPLAENEYEVNPNAIIYVQIQPREHDRTYRHQRYTNMRGKTQHIDPRPRLQPMTIASFRQLKQIQRITKVFASKFDQA